VRADGDWGMQQSAIHAQTLASADGVDVSTGGVGRYTEAGDDLAYGHGAVTTQRRSDPPMSLLG